MAKTLLLLSYGAPECKDDVIPFLQNVLAGKNVPSERLQRAAQKYYEVGSQTGAFSPLNAECRELIAGLLQTAAHHGEKLDLYWGNLYWHPLLADTIAEMTHDGITEAACFATSAFDSPQGNQRYLDAIEAARKEVEKNLSQPPPIIRKLPLPYKHPLFIKAQTDMLLHALAYSTLEENPAETESGEIISDTVVLFSTHSIPIKDAERSHYVEQLNECCTAVADKSGKIPWELVFQSRSGVPTEPWLEPDIKDRIRNIASEGRYRSVVVVPIGFFCENFETVFDLDLEVGALCDELGLGYIRARAVGGSRNICRMIFELLS